jgi:hypothetical protein
MRPHIVPLLLAASCIDPVATEHQAGHSATVERDCIAPPPSGLVAPGAPVALELDYGSLWLWNEPTLAAGGTVPNAAALVVSVDAGCAGSYGPLVAPVVPLLPSEAAENRTRSDGKRTVPVPRGGFSAGGHGYLYYDVVVRGPGVFDEERLGTGVCIIDSPNAPCVRDDHLLWGAGQTSWAASGFSDVNGLAYLAACHHVAADTDLCGLARVAAGSTTDPTAYRFWSKDGWATDASDYDVAFSGISGATLGPRAFGGVLAVSRNIWDSTIEARMAPAGPGSFSPPFALVAAKPPSAWFIGGGAWHQSLDRDGLVTVSYSNDDGVHLVQVRID